MQLDRINDWLWCLRTRIVQAYAVRERDGFNLIDTSTAGEDGAILELLATIDPRADAVRIHEIVLTHGHDDHTAGRWWASSTPTRRRRGRRRAGWPRSTSTWPASAMASRCAPTRRPGWTRRCEQDPWCAGWPAST
jgi:glyoxylase-like metal-dependent hydrolase (beta-lactamase superfamily II)